jgi:hypothetical protein
VKGHHRLSVHRKDWACFAEVHLDVVLTPDVPGLRLELPEAPLGWEGGVRFGLAYAFEQVQLHSASRGGAHVRILELRGTVVDTTEAAAAFVAAWAFFEAVGVEPPEGLRLDVAARSFCFPS